MSLNYVESYQSDHKHSCCQFVPETSSHNHNHLQETKEQRLLYSPTVSWPHISRLLADETSIRTSIAALWEKERLSAPKVGCCASALKWKDCKLLIYERIQTHSVWVPGRLLWEKTNQNQTNGRQTDPHVLLSSCCKHWQLCHLVSSSCFDYYYILLLCDTSGLRYWAPVWMQRPPKCQTKPKNKEGEYWRMRCYLGCQENKSVKPGHSFTQSCDVTGLNAQQ